MPPDGIWATGPSSRSVPRCPGYLVPAGVLALAAIIALAMIRASRQRPMSEPAGDASVTNPEAMTTEPGVMA